MIFARVFHTESKWIPRTRVMSKSCDVLNLTGAHSLPLLVVEEATGEGERSISRWSSAGPPSLRRRFRRA